MKGRSRVAAAAIVAFVGGGGAVVVLASCGTSKSARYESDVRFERCMALDWQGDVDPQIRRGCWDEWVRHFTRGQTRDRIAYAKRELDKLASNDVALASASANEPIHAIPEPTSVFTPPPMMMTPDAGAPTDGGVDAAPDAAPPANPLKNECMKTCDAQHETCERSCKQTWCMKSCAVQHASCVGFCP